MKADLKQMLDINQEQRVYYDNASGSTEAPINSGATNLWRRIRARLFAGINSRAVQDSITKLHLQWIGDVSSSDVLDLGVGTGNPLSFYLAERAARYVAIDLSPNRISDFRRKLDENPWGPKAKLYAADFLDRNTFPEEAFNLVYAQAIFHHFQHFEAFLEELHSRMLPGGMVVTLDPLQTWAPARFLRAAYRPFQTDKAWEWPLSRASLKLIARYFQIEAAQGIYGQSKWALPLGLLSPGLARQKAQNWHEQDLKNRTSLNRIGSCLQLSLRLRAK